MRLRLTWVLFVLGVLAAGCGGGGRSSVVPAVTGGNGVANPPTSAKSTRANISLYVPPQNKQAARKPFYISPNTQAFGVVVLPYVTPLPSPVPTTGIQIFPVTTPSPCAAASGGGETCSFTVTAPVGTDVFIVAAFAGTSPPPNSGPLSAFVSGPVTVSLSPSPGASPLAFTLDGVVNSVAVNVASPDPGNTPNTQTFTVGVPTSAPLSIVAYDSSGNLIMSDPTTPYFNPIVIQASPAADGLTLSLISASVCGSSASGAAATIDCAGDLDDVQVTYDGTPRPDASDHLIDTYHVYSTTAPNPTPSPANFVLQSNMLNYQLAPGPFVGNPGWLRRLANGQFAYLVYLESPVNGYVTGTFDPSTGTTSGQTALTDGNLLTNVAFLPDGSFWVLDSTSPGQIECFASLAATTPSVSNVVPTESYDGGQLWVDSIGADNNGNLWYSGWDWNYEGGGPPAPPNFAGFFSSSGCADPGTPVAQFTLTNAYGDSAPETSIAVNATGTAAVTTQSDYLLSNPYNGVWMMNTGSGSPINGAQTLNTANFGTAVAIDGTGNAYATFAGGSSPDDIEMLNFGSSAFGEVVTVPPATPGPYPNPVPSGLYVFSPSSTAADRAMYIDRGYNALALVEHVPSPALPILVSLPYSVYPLDAAYSSTGGEYVLDMDASENLNLVRIMPTTTWSVPNVAMNTGCGEAALLTILERGDSGPFTVSAGTFTVTPIPGADHDFWLSGVSNGTFAATVTDAHGRTENFQINAASSSLTCGAAHRRPPHAHVR